MIAKFSYKELKENMILVFVFCGAQYLLFSYTYSLVGKISLSTLQFAICILMALNLVILTQKTNAKLLVGCLAALTAVTLLSIKYLLFQ